MGIQLPVYIIMIPLLASLLIVIAGWVNKNYCYPLTIAAHAAALIAALKTMSMVLTTGPVSYRLGGWAPPWGIEYRVDHLSVMVLVVIAAVAFINLIASRKSVQTDFPGKISSFYGLSTLFVTGLMGVVITGDAFNLFVLLEITALTGYALIGMGGGHAPRASLNYVFMGTIGASFYLLGVGYLYLATGTLNMGELAALIPQMPRSTMILTAFIICLTGLYMKMALFPLHAWLPNAYTCAPPAAIGIIAPLTTKVMVYVLVRITLYVFTPEFSFARTTLNHSMVWLAVIAIVAGSSMALTRRNLKSILVYIIVAEVGYMVGGLWLANRSGITGAILHIVNDAAMTLCVFLAAGSIGFKLKSDSFGALKGCFRKMPFSMAALAVGGMSIIGVPPTCGFFSKWYLILGALEAGQYQFIAALIFSSLVNVVLFFKIFEIGYFEPFKTHEHHHGTVAVKVNEGPLAMVAMALLVSLGLVLLGLFSGQIVNTIIAPAIPPGIT